MTDLMENWAFKLLALVMAVFVWYFARKGSETVEMSFFIPLVLKNLPAEMRITSEVPSLINVSGKIARRRSRAFNPAEVQAVLELQNARTGRLSYTLTRQNITAPEEVEVVRINPSEVTFTVDQIIEKTLPVQAVTQGQPKKGYLLQGLELAPKEIALRGPKSMLDPLTTLYTSAVNLENLEASQNIFVRVEIPQKEFELVHPNEAFMVQVSIASIPSRKRFEKVPIYLKNSNYVTVINPKQIAVYLEGNQDVLDELDASRLYGVLDLSEYIPGTYQLRPEVSTPRNINVLQQWPTISVWIKPQKISTEDRALYEEPPPSNLATTGSP